MKNKKALEISNLYKEYFINAKKSRFQALQNISFSVEKGSIVAILGPNGAGKSSLINILAGTVNKSSGKVKINGFDIEKNEREAKLSIGVVPQELVIDPYFTPRETLNFQSGYYGIKKSKFLTEDLLIKLRLKDKANAYVRNLSGGMKRRLMIAKAMVHSPPILILDEPTAGVDVSLRQILWKNIRELNKNGTTVIITTHYLEEAESLCKEAVFVNKGRVVLIGKIKDLIKKIDKKILSINLSNKLTKIPSILKKEGFYLKNQNTLNITYKPSDVSAGSLITKVNSCKLKIKDVITKEARLEDLFEELTK